MEVNNYPLTCWWNGEVVVNGEDISYKGGCESFVLVSSNISFNELKSEIYESLEVDRSKFELNIKMKFPSVRGYKVVSLNNDRSLKALWAIVCQSKAGSMDLFIELKPIEEDLEITQTTLQPSNLSFTNMLSQVEDPNWHVSLSSNHVDEVAIDGNIFGDEIENGIEEEDALLLLSEDEDDMVDLVSQPCTNTQFIELGALDVGHENSWYKSCVAPFKSGEEFSKGQDFATKELLRQVVTTYNVARNQVYKIAESRPHTMTYKCNRQPSPCSWYLRATKKNIHMDVFTIVSYKGPHEASCVVRKPSLDHPNLRGGFISNAIKHLVKEDWGAKVSLLRASITKEFNFKISYWKTWMAKQRALADLYGDWEESYACLPRYLDALKEVNPGTAVHFVNKPTNDPNVQQFDKVFWSFGPSIKGFPHCRPIITIDGTHLYGKYRGTMLIAMAVDANEQLFPLAFAIVEKENYENWSWFLACIRHYVTNRRGLCVLSDRHAGILKSMSQPGSGWEEPYAFHRYCIRHHASNINKMFKDSDLKSTFSETAMQHQLRKFDLGMEKIGLINANARALLDSIPPSKWSLAHDGGKRYGLKTTNMSECFNGVLKGVRFLPIQALVKATNYEELHRVSIEKWNNRKSRLTPRGVPYTGYLDYNDPYLEWYRKITRLVISPLSTETQNKDLYEKRHNFYPNAADNMLLTQGHVYNYERATTMLGEMPDGVPLSHVNIVREMQSMSLECLQRTGHGHLILPTEADHPSPPHNEPPRYDLRHRAVQLTPIQEEATPSGSTSRQKGKRARSRLA